MSRYSIALMAALMVAVPAQGQEIQRYLERNNRVQAVTPDKRLPVVNGPNADPTLGLDTARAAQSSGGVLINGPSVFYSITITLAAGQGPGRVMIFDSAALPPDGALSGANLPLRCVAVDAGDRTAVFSSAIGLGMDTGIAWAFSTGANCQTKTSATADMVAIS